MKTATVRQVRHDFGTVLRWISEGEKVAISKRGKIVALLSPPPAVKRNKRKRPDLAARLRMRDGGRAISASVIADILNYDKGEN